MTLFGYVGRILRVDLGSGKVWDEELEEGILRLWVGGVALGAKYLVEEVGPSISWDDAANCLIFTTGPVAGSGYSGAATFNVVSKGPMTDMAGSSQANGFMGAYMKFSGFDGVIVQGRSDRPVYLELRDGTGRLRDASHVWGLGVKKTEDMIRQELGCKRPDVSVFGIGPAGENLVRYAAIVGDNGHVAAHNGLGAVMGAKRLKAIVAYRGRSKLQVAAPEALKEADRECFSFMKDFGPFYKWGTGGGLSAIYAQGALPREELHHKHIPSTREHERPIFEDPLSGESASVLQMPYGPCEGGDGHRGALQRFHRGGAGVRADSCLGTPDR